MTLKGFIRKFITVTVLGLLFMNSSFLTIVSTALEFIDTSQINAVVETTLDKYVNYTIGEDKKGTLVSLHVKSGIEYPEDQEYSPLLFTGITLNLPKIEDTFPENVEVIGLSTRATNGNDLAKDFNYSYDKEQGTLSLVARNLPDENGTIYSEKVSNARDEYHVICYYNEICYSDENPERTLLVKASIQETINRNNEEITISNEKEQEFNVVENISGLISTDIVNSEVYDGYIHSNQSHGTHYSTKYTEQMNLQIDYANISDGLKIDTSKVFVNTENKNVPSDSIQYLCTRINKNDVLAYFGENGFLQIVNENGEIIQEINKDTVCKEDGTVTIIYENSVSSFSIRTSRPLKAGTFPWKNLIQINDTMTTPENHSIKTYSTITAKNIEKQLDEELHEVLKEEDKDVYQYSNDAILEMKDAETRVDLSMDQSEWTNSIQNDVTFTATFVTNSNRYRLFKNPVIDIKLPKEVDNVILGNISLLYDNGLAIQDAQVIDVDESKSIRVSLTGTQTDYNTTSIVSGATLSIEASLLIAPGIESSNQMVQFTYSNEDTTINDYNKQGKESKEYEVSITSISNDVQPVALAEEAPSTFTIERDENANLAVSVQAQVGNETLKENDTVYEREIITYIIAVTNQSDVTATNITGVAQIAEGTTYVTKDDSIEKTEEETILNPLYTEDSNKKQVDIPIDTLEAGNTYTYTYKVMVNDLENIAYKNIESQIYFHYKNQEIYNRTISLKAEEAKLNIEVYPPMKEYNGRYYWIYTVLVKNISPETISNVVLESEIAKEYNYQYSYGANIDEIYDKEDHLLKLNFGDIPTNETKMVLIRVSAENFEEGTYDYTIPFVAKVYVDGEKNKPIYRSDVDFTEALSTEIGIVQTSEREGQDLTTDEEIEYNFSVTNKGKLGTYVTITDNLPQGIIPLTANYEMYEVQSDYITYLKVNKEKDLAIKTITEEGEVFDFKLKTYIPAGESISISIKGQAECLSETIEAINVATVFGNEITTKTSNAIKNRILAYQTATNPTNPTDPSDPTNPTDPTDPSDPTNPTDPTDPSDPTNPTDPTDPSENKTYRINGIAWLDSNKNGKMDEEEKKIQGITVQLFHSETNSIVKDSNGNNAVQQTDENGIYQFSNIPVGNYLIVFEYDTSNYRITTYKSNGISENLNSDVISKSITMNGIEKNVAITDTLKIQTSNLDGINMGLIQNGMFDLSLEKYIDKITVTDNTGEKQYAYDNAKLAKVEIHAKQINSTNITIEYKFVVKNEGNIDAYANEITDYLPEGLTFDQSKNKNWTQSTSGLLTNGSLTGISIAPDESKEITLLLTKEMSEDSTGTIINTAEISKSYNAQNLKDLDSTENNQNNIEDDYSKAEVIVSLKTGLVRNLIYIFIALATAIVIAYFIKKGKINGATKLLIALVVFGFVFPGNETDAVRRDGDTGMLLTYPELHFHRILDTETWELINGRTPDLDIEGFNAFCINPELHLCSSADHHYTLASESAKGYSAIEAAHNTSIFDQSFIAILDTFFSGYSNIEASEFNVQWNENEQQYNINNSQIGPFTVTWTGGGENINSSLSIKLDGTPLSEGTHYSVIPSVRNNTTYTFFIQPTESFRAEFIKGSRIDVHLDLNGSSYYYKRFMYFKNYNFAYADSGCTCAFTDKYGYSYYPSKAVQNMKLGCTGIESGYKPTKATPEWSYTLPKGSLKIHKFTYPGENWNNPSTYISGATFTITGPSYPNGATFKTQEDGTVTIPDLLVGTYHIRETGVPNGYYVDKECAYPGSGEELNNGQLYGSVQVSANQQTNSYFANKKYGKITIHKKELYKNGSLSGAEFKLYDSDWNFTGKSAITDEDGNAVIDQIKMGSYHLVETGLPPGCFPPDADCISANQYIIDNPSNKKEKALCQDFEIAGNGGDFEVTFKNKCSITLTISKKDEDAALPIEGMGFILYYEGSADANSEAPAGFIKTYTPSADSNANSLVTYSGDDISQAKVFYTNNSGTLTLRNIKSGTYRIYEAALKDNTDAEKYYDLKNPNFHYIDGGQKTEDKIFIEYNGETVYGATFECYGEGTFQVYSKNEVSIFVKNKQQYVDISGFIWEDIPDPSKNNEKNHIYNTPDGDVLVKSAMPVSLVTFPNGIEDEPSIKTVNTDTGSYKFTKVKITDLDPDPKENLDDAYIQFEYNGLKYKVVPTQIPTKESITSYGLIGDIDGNGLIDTDDALLPLKSNVGLITLTDHQEILADVNWDGFVDVLDALDILKVLVGTINLKGDVNSDRKFDQSDIDHFQKYLDGQVTLNDKEKIAASMNTDNQLDEKDLKVMQAKLESISTTITKEQELPNTSKVEENSDDRKAFNESFEIITTGDIEGNNSDYSSGASFKGNKQTNALHYKTQYLGDNNNANSSLVQNTDYLPTSEYVTAMNDSPGISMKANTRTAGYQLVWSPGVKEIKWVNLGLEEREQPNIVLRKDLHNVKLEINGYSHTYFYAQRFNAETLEDAIDANGFNIGVKYKNKYTGSYSRAIYKSDYDYEDKLDPIQKSGELKAYVTYNIQLENHSTNLTTKINSIVDYFDKNYEIQQVGKKISNTTGNILNPSEAPDSSEYNSQYKKVLISTENIGIDSIAPGKTANVYIQFSLNKEAIGKIINYKENLKNVAEINSYSIYDKNGKIYAGIDVDSCPGNAIPGNENSYENDTDRSPDLGMIPGPRRQMTGKVFEDAVIPDSGQDATKVMTGKVREGNGQYDNNDKGIGGILVTLTDKKGSGKVYKTETISQKATKYGFIQNEKGIIVPEPYDNAKASEYLYTYDNNVEKDAPLDIGDFYIQDYIPGDYVLTYTWGDKTYTIEGGGTKDYPVQDYKGTIYDYNRYESLSTTWYKTDIDIRKTDALDDYATRIAIDKEMETVKHNTETHINQMISSAPKEMAIGVEYNTRTPASVGETYIYQIKNIDFGIVERAKQDYTIEKRINSMKVSLANGQVIADLTIDEDGKIEGERTNVTYMGPYAGNNGFLKLEVDNELIQGAKLEVTYRFTITNQSELDYIPANKDYYHPQDETSFPIFYHYGNETMKKLERDGNLVSPQDVITITPSAIMDYLDDDWSIDMENNKDWTELKTLENLKKKGEYSLVAEVVYMGDKSNKSDINNRKIIYSDKLSSTTLEPIMNNIPNDKNTRTIDLNVFKILTTTDEISLDNDVEITEIQREGGSTPIPTPGNYIPGSGKKENDDSIAETVTVTLATGENRSYMLPILIGTTALIILGMGIVLIKKKTLDT